MDGAGHDDEPGHNVGEDAARHHVEAGSFVLATGHALLDDGSLQVELHPGRDGGAHDADHHVQVVLAQKHFLVRRNNRGFERLQPCRLGEKSGDDVSEIEERGGQKNLLHRLVLALDHDQPDDHGANRDGVVLVEAEQLQTAGDAGKFA